MLDVQLPDLLPELRPYQSRAAYWMIQREKGGSDSSGSERNQFVYPLCMPLNLVETSARMYYNPFWYRPFLFFFIICKHMYAFVEHFTIGIFVKFSMFVFISALNP